MKYPLKMKIFHWALAVLILGLIGFGWYMTSLDADVVSAVYEVFYPLHKSFGILAFILIVMRCTTRIRSDVPEAPKGLKRWERVASKLAHRLLYALMIIVPIMGYCMSSTFEYSDGVVFFGLLLPEVLPKSEKGFEIFQMLHSFLAYTLLGLVFLHVAGALKHRFLDKDGDTDVLGRML